MKNKELWWAFAVVLIGGCLVSAIFGYQAGYSSAQRDQRAKERAGLKLPGTVDVYGCGVDQFIRVDPTKPVQLHKLLSALQPLPSAVNGVFLWLTNLPGATFGPLTQALATNGLGALPLSGGERILLVHQFQ